MFCCICIFAFAELSVVPIGMYLNSTHVLNVILKLSYNIQENTNFIDFEEFTLNLFCFGGIGYPRTNIGNTIIHNSALAHCVLNI